MNVDPVVLSWVGATLFWVESPSTGRCNTYNVYHHHPALDPPILGLGRAKTHPFLKAWLCPQERAQLKAGRGDKSRAVMEMPQ